MEQLPPVIHKSWHPLLEPLFQTTEIKHIKYYVLPKCNFYPTKENIFRVFSIPVEEIKIVILGQDPYPNKGQAIGYAFAVSKTTPKPASLRNIEKEIGHEIQDITLQHWVKQGVFLLNTALTVEAKKAGSHTSYWKSFTNAVISGISVKINPIWVLWGNYAKSYQSVIRKRQPNADILMSPHPAAESYSGGKAGFFGCDHFNIANQILIKRNKTIINW